MSAPRSNSIRLFRAVGIDVHLHWSWLVVAVYQIGERAHAYASLTWNVAEYLSLFLIVLLHEFGHALACRQVGGRADQIVLWPLGGVAYVAPPPRPGATLWSIAAGPLVNVVLAVPLTLLLWVSRCQGWAEAMPNAHGFVRSVWLINTILLIFNLLPIYPLDGGQILRSLLWFLMGRARSLFVAVVIGFIGVVGIAALAFWMRSIWMGVVAVFMFARCRAGWRQAHALSAAAHLARRAGFMCPSCGGAPPLGPHWVCAKCRAPFDTFETGGECPQCHSSFPRTQCLDCGQSNPLSAWRSAVPADATRAPAGD